jgi:branched-chain amino acid aminotransferase
MKVQEFPYTFFKGKIVKTAEAVVPINTNALQYGTAVFGGMRGYYSAKNNAISVFRIDDHYTRFLSSIKIFDCAFPYTVADLKKITLDLLQKNNPSTDVYFRPFAYVGHTELGPNLAESKLDFALYMIPLGEYLPVNKGLKVMVSSWRRVSDNAIPSRAKISGAYVNSALARKEAHENGYDEAIFLNDSGHVCEGSAENIFIVRDGVLITPPPSDDILEGITRRSILELAKEMNIPVLQRTIDRSELYVCQEAFFAGTGVQAAWIESVDRRKIGDGKKGKITTQIQERFFKVVRGQDEEHQSWCTKVSVS